MIESSDAMVSVLGFTGVPGRGWRVASYGVPIRRPFGRVSAPRSTLARLVLAALAPRLRALERGPSSARLWRRPPRVLAAGLRARLPDPVLAPQTVATGPVAGGDRRGAVREEHAAPRVAPRQRGARRPAVEAPVDPRVAVAAERAGAIAQERDAVGAEEPVALRGRRFIHDRWLVGVGRHS